MTEDRLPLADLLAKAGDGDFLRSVAEAVVQLLMETDVEGLIGLGRHKWFGDRTTYRNGYSDRMLDTRLGSLQRVGSGAPNPQAAARCHDYGVAPLILAT
jgi:transposase-like protein